MPHIVAAFIAGLLVYRYYGLFPYTLSLLAIVISVICVLNGWRTRHLIIFVSVALAAAGYSYLRESIHFPCFSHHISGIAEKWRTRLTEIIFRSLPTDSAAINAALITGFRAGISPEVREAFNATGLAHLLSISGTHFGLLALVIFKSIRAFLKTLPERLMNVLTIHITPTQAAAIISLPLLGLYMLISGAAVPAVRAMIMTSIYMAGLAAGRRGNWIYSISTAALVILIWQPQALFELSFLLSFTAVLSIGLIAECSSFRKLKILTGFVAAERPLGMSGIGAMKGLIITVAVTLGTAPIVLNAFGSLPVYAPATNLLITPLVCFVILPAGLLTAATAVVLDLPVMPLSEITDTVTRLCIYVIKLLSSLPMSRVYLPPPAPILTLIYYVSLIIVLWGKGLRRFVPLTIVLILYLSLPLIHSSGLTATFLDVGQGDSAVVEFPDGKIMLIDGGSSEARSGPKRIEPFLRSKGIQAIDYLVVTHNHPDHIGGLAYIVDRFRVGEVWISGKNISGMHMLLTKIYERHIPVRIVHRGDYIDMGSYLIIVLHPLPGVSPGYQGIGYADENNDSVVLRIESAGGSILLAGDIHKETEQELLALGAMLDADVIKVPHHGSRTSAWEGFIDLVSPEAAVISVGRNNPFGHPHRETLMMYARHGVSIYRTDRDGSVSVNLRQSREISVKTTGGRRFKEVRELQDEIENLLALMR
jgi:competence protein ComEC